VGLVDRDEARRTFSSSVPSSFPASVSGVVMTSSGPPRAISASAARRSTAADCAVEPDGRDAELLQFGVLVLEERQEGRDDDRRMRKEQRRELVAERLAATGG
jgi:hypothetical protein